VRNIVSEKNLAKVLKSYEVPTAFASDIVKAFANRCDVLVAAAAANSISLPSISKLNWRVDVAISTTSQSRVFKPSVTFRTTLSDGRIRTFECSAEQFHQLRYGVAKVLKSVNDLESHPMLQRDLA
jgi:COMM domain containing 5